ncbi:aldo/keto reductase family protein [Ascoidea rubescens DSM 1968]|uniref:Aldo/keto reductase n=1 Tax=Ascoidea rubescens DSM 1968 TaxID=1344418 RepID=A0A1D2VHV1_9ASCO|nr:Aldo/keto reductase [Ascoidea rubescens DSM 1968]ODV61057.1 Aldo/keto reductase [Ascoidea rubescens DSM 1968]
MSKQLNSGYSIPEIGLGVYLTAPNQAFDIVYQALKLGYRHIDSAEAYGNEKEVCQGIRKWLDEDPANNLRKDVFYTTKIRNYHHGYEKAKKCISTRVQIAEEFIDYIDLILIHDPMSNQKLRLETWNALQESVASGKVKSIGVSNYNVNHIKEIYNSPDFEIPPAVNQIELNPWLMRTEIVDYCKSKQIVVEAYSPLTRGLRVNDPELIQLAKKYNVSTAQILLRWSLDQGFVILPKTIKVSRAQENLSVLDFKMTKEDSDSLSHPHDYYVSIPAWDPCKFET